MIKWPFILRRAHNNEVARLNRTIHSLGLTIQSLRFDLKNKEEELRIASKNDRRDPRTGRFVKAH